MGSRRLLILGSAGLLLLLFGPRLLRWGELKGREAQLQAEIASLKAQNRELFEEARRLREDPAYAEAVARKELGLVRPGETVIKVKSRPQAGAGAKKDTR